MTCKKGWRTSRNTVNVGPTVTTKLTLPPIPYHLIWGMLLVRRLRLDNKIPIEFTSESL